MAHTLLTPDIIARAAIATLYAQTQMANLVHRDFEADFDGQVGDTVTVRKPATFTAAEFVRATGITLQDATETGVPVTLNKLLDVSFAITAEQWALEIKDFQAQFLSPAMEAISQKVDAMLLGLSSDVTQLVPLAIADETAKNSSVQLIDAGKILNDAKVPLSNRYTVLSTHKAAMYLRDPLFHAADKRGDTVGLIEAAIGRKFGFDTYMSQNETATLGLAFHRDAFALVTKTLAVPRGVATSQAAVAQYKGLGIRVLYSYDVTKKQDVISLDLLCGVKTLDATRAAILSAAA
jgi:hypothetical protein